MSRRRIHKSSDGLRHRSWAATTDEEEEKKNLAVLQGSRESGVSYGYARCLSEELQSVTEIQETDFNSVSSYDSNNLEVVSGIHPMEQEVEREKIYAAPSPTDYQDSATTKELKQATKFSYFATALAGGGIISLLIFHLESKSGEPHTLFFKALTSSVLATFVCGLSIILLTIYAPPASYQMPIIRGLVSATLIFLELMGVGVSIVLMKIMSELVFVPVIVVVIIACIIVHCKKTDPVNIGRNNQELSNHHPCDV